MRHRRRRVRARGLQPAPMPFPGLRGVHARPHATLGQGFLDVFGWLQRDDSNRESQARAGHWTRPGNALLGTQGANGEEPPNGWPEVATLSSSLVPGRPMQGMTPRGEESPHGVPVSADGTAATSRSREVALQRVWVHATPPEDGTPYLDAPASPRILPQLWGERRAAGSPGASRVLQGGFPGGLALAAPDALTSASREESVAGATGGAGLRMPSCKSWAPLRSVPTTPLRMTSIRRAT